MKGKVTCVNSLSLSPSPPPPLIPLFSLLLSTLSSPLLLSWWSAELPTEVNGGDKLTNQKLVQHKVTGHRSADSMSDGKSRPTGQWLHTLEIYTPLSFYRKLNCGLCEDSKQQQQWAGLDFCYITGCFNNITEDILFCLIFLTYFYLVLSYFF